MLLLALGAGACRKGVGPRRLVLATTTSVRDCGLLDLLTAAFEKETGSPVAPIAVGSGEALRMGRDGNADVLLVHDPAGEDKLTAEGIAAEDTPFMRSRFLVVGPASDPAGLGGLSTAGDVFRALAAGKAPFVSRGDDSGTHRLEKRFWQAAEVEPEGRDWYLSVGAGMMHALRVANEKQAYCLTDIATWLKARPGLDLAVVADPGTDEWANVYSILLLSPAKFPELNHQAARRFREFVVSGAGRTIVDEFGEAEFGAAVFERVE
ncbi:MAG: substrate-binding domain-containing protein [Deltaproteobacteria bacterium]|nr:substrate-binding domain-containing protein [Deltaproteobacteria bacterium]